MVASIEKTETKQASLEVLGKVKSLISSEGLTQKAIAKKTGLSETVVSMYLKNEYDGDLEKVEKTFKRFLEYTSSEKQYKRVQLNFVQTSVATKVFNIAKICQFNGEMALCTGSAGLGKTSAIKQYEKENNGVIVIDPDEKIKARNLLGHIGMALGMKIEQSEPITDFAERLVKRLKGSNRLIIVDEAENLDISCFRVLRKLHDRCDFTLGLLFLGTEALANKLVSLKGEYNYIFTRFGYIDYLEKLSLKDVSKLVMQIFPNVDNSTLEQFAKYSKLNARILFNLLKRTSDMVASTEKELNSKMVKAAAMYVGASR